MSEEMVVSLISEHTFGIWFLIGAALVFWMQAGFAMVEAGFTRAKNSGNILMKNLMDFCIGTVVFILIGFSLLLGEDMMGLIGKPGFDIFTAYADFDFSNFVFNLVFCATTATIVSGAMAERTKFLSYCIYSGVISALIYPIEAHWIWGGGWLAQLGFHDFAGSCAIHMVGGISALIGAMAKSPRSMLSQGITCRLAVWAASSSGLAGTDLTVRLPPASLSLAPSFWQPRLPQLWPR